MCNLKDLQTFSHTEKTLGETPPSTANSTHLINNPHKFSATALNALSEVKSSTEMRERDLFLSKHGQNHTLCSTDIFFLLRFLCQLSNTEFECWPFRWSLHFLKFHFDTDVLHSYDGNDHACSVENQLEYKCSLKDTVVYNSFDACLTIQMEQQCESCQNLKIIKISKLYCVCSSRTIFICISSKTGVTTTS